MEEDKVHEEMALQKMPTKRPEYVDMDDYSEEERAECYENCLNCCGRCQGFIATWICCCCESPYRRIPEGSFGIIK